MADHTRPARALFPLLLPLLLLISTAPVALACTSDANCDDLNPCTDDLCDPFLGCLHTDNSLGCTDGNACTLSDVCVEAVCVGGNTAAACVACQAVAVLPPQGGTFGGTTSGASTLAGSCGGSGTSPERVYQWTPPSSGIATISTCGAATTYDTVVYLRSASCDLGVEVACNNDTTGCAVTDGSAGADHHGSSITPTVTAGQTYFIVVDGAGGSQGTYRLTVTPPQTCGNNIREGTEQCDGASSSECVTQQCTAQCTCVPPAGGQPDLVPQLTGVTLQLGTTVPSGDVVEGCAEATTGVDLLRFSVYGQNNGTADITLGNPGCPDCTTCPLCVCTNPEFICSPAGGHNHGHYSNFARYELLDATDQALVVGHKQGFCLDDTVCTPPATAKYFCTNQGITAGCTDIYGSNLGCQYLDVTGVAPGSYTLRVTLDPFDKIAELNESNNVVTVPVTIPGDACATPVVLPAQGGTVSGTTSGVSSQSGSCAAATGGAPERAFQWTPAVSGTATIRTCGAGTTFDTVLYVRTGTCGGTELACNDDTASCATGDPCANSTHHGSVVTPTVTAGQRYFIIVDGYAGSCGGASGAFSLTVIPPAGATTSTTTSTTSTTASTAASSTTTSSTSTTTSTAPPPSTTTTSTLTGTTSTSTTTPNACATPVVLPAQGGTVSGTTSGVSSQSGTCTGATSGAPERVFQWTPAGSGTATIRTCGAGTTFDTVLYVRTGTCDSGPELACNDDTASCATGDPCGNSTHHGSLVTPTVTAGQTYFIIVDGYAGSCGGASGAFTLTVIPPAGATTTTSTTSTTASTAASSTTTSSTSTTPSTAAPPSTTTTSSTTTSTTRRRHGA